MTNKYKRSQEYKDLRELHKLYNKHEPVLLLSAVVPQELVVCSCGRLLKRPNTWGHIGEDNSQTWVPINHADKRRLRKYPRFQQYLRGAI